MSLHTPKNDDPQEFPSWIPDLEDKKAWSPDALPKNKERLLFQKLAKDKEPITEEDLRSLENIVRRFEQLENDLEEAETKEPAENLEKKEIQQDLRGVREHLRQLRESVHTILELSQDIVKKEAQQPSEANRQYCEFRRAALQQNQRFIREIATRLERLPKRPGTAGSTLLKMLAVLSFLGLTSFAPQTDVQPIEKNVPAATAKTKMPPKKINGKQKLKIKMRGRGEDLAWDDEEESPEGDESQKHSPHGHGKGRGGRAAGNGDGNGENDLDEQNNDSGRPNMNGDIDQETGIPKGQIGTLEFADEEAKTKYGHSLWVTRTAQPLGAEKNYELQEDFQRTGNAKKIATVQLKHVKVKAGESYHLPRPAGTVIGSGIVAHLYFYQEGRGSQSVTVKKNKESQVKFEEDAMVTIEYEVFEGTASLTEAEAIDERDESASTLGPDEKAVIEQIKGAPASAPMLLHHYAHNFTYITSTQLQNLLDQIPGSFQDKIQFIRFGDCDVLAHHMGDLTQKAGLPAEIIRGFLMKDGKTFSTRNRHAQVVFEEGKEVSVFEATAGVKKTFKNVRFRKQDRQDLQAIVKKIQDAPDYDSQIEGYKEFNAELEKILAKPEYQKFQSEGNSSPERKIVEKIQDELKKNGEKMEDDLQKIKSPGFWKAFDQWMNSLPDGGQIAMIVLMLFLGLGALVGSGFGMEIGYRKGREKLTEKEIEKFRRRIQDVMSGNQFEGDESTGQKPYSSNQWTPLDVYGKTTPEGRNIINLLTGLMSRYGPDEMLTYLFVRRGRWDNIFEKIEKSGGDAHQMKKILQQIFENPRARKAAERDKENVKREILEDAKSLIRGWMDRESPPKANDHARIKTDILKIRSTGDEAVARRKAPYLPGVWPSFESQKYEPGDDYRDIDWAYYARTGQLVVDPGEPEVDKERIAKEKYVLAIDVGSSTIRELTHLAAFLYYVQRFPGQIHITGIELYADGMRLRSGDTPLQTFEDKTGKIHDGIGILKKIQQRGPEGMQAIQGFIKHLVDLRVEHAWHKKYNRKNRDRRDSTIGAVHHADINGMEERRKALKKNQKLLIVGRTCSEKLDNVYYFLTEEEKKEREAEKARAQQEAEKKKKAA